MTLLTLAQQVLLQYSHHQVAYSVGVICIYILLQLSYNRYSSPLRKYPGPVLASYTRLWQVWVAWTGKAEEHYMAAHQKYGPIVRIGPNEISLASAFAGVDLFKTGQGFSKTEFYTVFLPHHIKDIFTEIRERVHAGKKRFAVPAYSLAAVQKHTPAIEVVMRNWLSRLDGFAAQDKEAACDLGSWLHYLAFDTLGQFAFRKTFGFIEAGNDFDGGISSIATSLYHSAIIGQIPILDSLTRRNPILSYIPFLPKEKSFMLDAATEMMTQHQDINSSSKDDPSLLRSLLDAHESNSDKFSMVDVLAVSMGAVAAGSDSTASTMQSFVWHVLNDAKIHAKLVTEILDAPLSEIVQFKEGLALPYFQACLNETLRLKPAVGMNITRYIPPSGAEIADTWIPGGSQVAVNAWVLHRDTKVFGVDADSFNPERWFSEDKEHLKTMKRCMIHFGGGSHVCIGRHLALFEINKALPQLFRRYTMQLANPGMPLDHCTGFFYVQSGLHVHMEQRVKA